ERGSVAVGHPMVLGPVAINGWDSLSRLPRDISNLRYSQTFEVIVPPIEPPPKKRRELAMIHYRHHNVETFRRSNRFIQMRQDSVGFVPEDVDCEFTVFECGLQSAQFVDQAKAGDKQGDFGCVKQELLVLPDSNLRLGRRFVHPVATGAPVLRRGFHLNLAGAPRIAIPANTDTL